MSQQSDEQTWIVETRINPFDQWETLWVLNDEGEEPETFPSREDARAALEDLFLELDEDNVDYDRADYRIRQLTQED